MKRVSMVAVVALVAALAAVPASAAPTKWVRGPVTAMTGNSITVTVNGAASTYTIENDDAAASPAGRGRRVANRSG